MSLTSGTLARGRARLREKGLRRFLTTTVAPRFYRRWASVLLERDLTVPLRTYRPRKDIAIRQIEAFDDDVCRRYFAEHETVYRRLLDEGCLCFGGFRGPDLIAASWFALKTYHDGDVHHFTFRCREGEAYQFAGLLAPEFRNTAISIHVVGQAWTLLHDLGFTSSYCAVDVNNTPSMRWHAHSGFRERGEKLITTRLTGQVWSRLEPYSGSELDRYRKRPRAHESPADVTASTPK